jgi:hypothetical protein
VDRRDLGSVGAEVEKIVRKERANLPRGTTLTLRGEYETMRTSFFRLGLGIIFAVVLVYLLMAVNFQSWLDPFIILTALPGAMAGILWMLFVTGTTLSVPSLVGRSCRLASRRPNSILLVTFANDERVVPRARGDAVGRLRTHPAGADDGCRDDPRHAADGACARRGRQQNAPLGRAVIGGLLVRRRRRCLCQSSLVRGRTPANHERRLHQEEAEELLIR